MLTGVGTPSASMSADVSTVTEVVVEQPPPIPSPLEKDSTSLQFSPRPPILSPTPLVSGFQKFHFVYEPAPSPPYTLPPAFPSSSLSLFPALSKHLLLLHMTVRTRRPSV